jgi:outer membrane protein TolC
MVQSSPGSDPRSGAVGLQLNIPLFTGYRNTYRVYQARQQAEAQAATRDRLASDISLDVWSAYQDLRTQRQALDTAGDLLASAQENYNVALARYKAGVGTITDLLNAQSALVGAELQRIRARYQWNLAKATLAKAIGVLQPDLIGQRASPTYNR